MINKCLVECPPLVFVLEKLLLGRMDKKRNHAIETRHCDADSVLSKCVCVVLFHMYLIDIRIKT